jgi:hypothetical protein
MEIDAANLFHKDVDHNKDIHSGRLVVVERQKEQLLVNILSPR